MRRFRYLICLGILSIRLIRNWWVLLYYLSHNKKQVHLDLKNGIKFVTNNHILDLVAILENFASVNNHNYFSKVDFNSNPVIIDIGAHIGTFCIYAAKKYPSGIIYSYEPDKMNYEKLSKNVKMNNVTNVYTYNLAVCKERGKTSLFPMQNTDFGTVGSTLTNTGEEPTMIECVTLQDILGYNKIDMCNLLKMDCEGAEYEIILSSDINIFTKIESISMEYHEVKDHTKNELEVFLRKVGYNVVSMPNEMNKEFGFIHANRFNT